MAVNELSDADVEAISIVTKGANRKRIFLKKEHADDAQLVDFPGAGQIIKTADWSRFYCVVAEPGAEEDPGVLAKDQSVPDRWASEDEIRKAQESFVRNGGLINKLHESLDPYGQLVENAIALADFQINGETIRKGSWYVAVLPTEEGRSKIDAGDFTGLSIQGTATRTLVEKASQMDADCTALDSHLIDRKGKLKLAKLAKMDGLGPDHWAELAEAMIAKGLMERVPGIQNWVDRVGGLPNLIDRAAAHIHAKGRSISAAIATAVNWAKKMCSTGRSWGGKVAVSGGAKARACAAVAEWEAKKAKARVTKSGSYAMDTEDSVLETIAKRRPFEERKHPRKGGKFAPAGSGGGGPAKASTPEDAQRNRNATAANILGSLGYKGKRLSEALTDFQKKNNLPVTGKADPQTMVTLRSKMAGRRRKNQLGPGEQLPPPKKKGPKRRRGKVGKVSKLATVIGKALGVDPAKLTAAIEEDEAEAIDKSATTFAERMAQRELDNELPDALSVLRSVVFRAFNPYPEDGDVDPKAVISDSLDQFKEWCLGLLDRVSSEEVAKMIAMADEEAILIEKARLSTADRKKLPKSAFVFPEKAPGPGSYPIHDLPHAKAALSLAGGKPEESKVRAAVFAKFPQLKPEKVGKAAGPKSESATVNPMDGDQVIGTETEASVEDRLSDLEATVAKITPENIAKAMRESQPGDGNGNGDGTGDGEGEGAGSGGEGGSDGGDQAAARQPITKEDLEKELGKVADAAVEKINGIQSQIDKLAEGESSQGGDPVEKSDAQREKVRKAYEAEGFKPEEGEALAGIFS